MGATVEGPLGADFSTVVAVRLADGTGAVAKVPPANDDSRDEGAALAAWAGVGAVRLLDERDGVLLLERAVPATPTTSDAVLARCLRQLWIDPPAGVGWRVADELAPRWIATIGRWRHVIGARLTDAAVAVLTEGFGDGQRVLLHGDGHHANVLDGGDRGWLAIDPQPLVGPPALDLVPALFNGPEAPVGERIAVLAAETGVDQADLRRLAVPRCVLSGAWGLDRGSGASTGWRCFRVAAELL